MRWTVLALALLLSLASVAAYPLHGGNGIINCTVFGAIKAPLPYGPTADKITFSLDLAQESRNLSGGQVLGAPQEYELVDGNHQTYEVVDRWSRDLGRGRRQISFEVPIEMVAKSLRVNPVEGNPFTVEWGDVPEDRDRWAVLRYYGMVEDKSSIRKVTLDLGVTNNGTEDLVVGPENFTMVDQWDWVYQTDGPMAPAWLKPNESTRFWITFGPISPFSVPSALFYNHSYGGILLGDGDSGELSGEPSGELSGELSDEPSDELSEGLSPDDTGAVCGNDTSLNSTYIPVEPLVIYIGDLTAVYSEEVYANATVPEPGAVSSPCCRAAQEPVDPNSVKGKVAAAKARLAQVKTS